MMFGDVQLVQACQEYKPSYIDYLQELITTGNDPAVIEGQIAAIDSMIERQRLGIVPELDYWLLQNDRVIATLQLRRDPQSSTQIAYDVRPSCRKQGIGTHLLTLGLIEAHRHGLSPVRITCLNSNIASRKIIERNGGVLQKMQPHSEGSLLYFQISN